MYILWLRDLSPLNLSCIRLIENVEEASLIHCTILIAFIGASNHLSQLFISHIFPKVLSNSFEFHETDSAILVQIEKFKCIFKLCC